MISIRIEASSCLFTRYGSPFELIINGHMEGDLSPDLKLQRLYIYQVPIVDSNLTYYRFRKTGRSKFRKRKRNYNTATSGTSSWRRKQPGLLP